MRGPALLLAIVCTATVTPLHAQIPDLRGRGDLQGVVIDNATEQPLAGVRVDVIDDARRLLHSTETDEHGHFHIFRMRPGPFMLRVARLGYRASTTPLWSIAGGQVLRVEVRMDMDAIVLAPLAVTSSRRATRPSPVLEGFRDRAAVGLGHFITRADIERRKPARVTDLLATVPGVQLESTGQGNRSVVYMTRSMQGRCPAQVYVDGALLNRRLMTGRDAGFVIDDAVNPASIEGIEVYRGLAGMPAEFLSPEASCGVVVIWTRRGDTQGG
jgi:hypothetical protein